MVHLVQHFVPIAHHLTVIWLVRGRRPTCPAELCHSTGVGVVVCRVNDERTSDRGRVLMCKGPWSLILSKEAVMQRPGCHAGTVKLGVRLIAKRLPISGR